VESRFKILKPLADCFRDYRDKERIEHSVESLIRQRVYGIALDYEHLNDRDSSVRNKTRVERIEVRSNTKVSATAVLEHQ
jgi:hypothetical protein